MNIRRASNYKNLENKKEKLTQLFDIKTLDLYCRYIISRNSNIKMSSLILVKNLFDKVLISDYGSDTERVKRINFIKKGLEARADKHLKDKDLIIQYINGGIGAEDLLDISGYEEISDDELAYINNESCSLSETYFVDEDFNEIVRLATDLHNNTGVNRANTINEIKYLIQKLNSGFNKFESGKNIESEFSLYDDTFDNTFRDIFSKETSPSRILKTGLSGLNQMLNGGFQSGRVYIFFGTAATGKSFFVLDIAMQISKYNYMYKTKDPTKQPCIIILTMENSVRENVSRMFTMITGEVMAEHTQYDEANMLFKNALEAYSGHREVDLFMEYQPNLSQSTNYLYALVDKVKSQNKEPICIIIDHIKRIRSIDPAKDMRLDLGNIVNEFKAFANIQDIPIITISHLNREAAKNIGENKNKKDIIRSLGVNNVSDSLLMIDNCDIGVILNKETDSKGNYYMGFSSIKSRTKCDVELFFQPFMEHHGLKLIEDAYSQYPAYRWTLIDKEAGPLRINNNDYVKTASKRIDDDEDMFSSNNIARDSAISVDDIANSSVVGVQVQSQIQQPQPYSNFEIQQPMLDLQPLPIPTEEMTTWEQELINLKYNTNSVAVFSILNDEGIVIGDSVEMYKDE